MSTCQVSSCERIHTEVGKVNIEEVFHALLQSRLRTDEPRLFVGHHGQFLVSDDEIETRDWQKQLCHFDQIHTDEYEFCLPELHAWHPDTGLQMLAAFQQAFEPVPSQITQLIAARLDVHHSISSHVEGQTDHQSEAA